MNSFDFLRNEIGLVLYSILLKLAMLDFYFDSAAGSFKVHKMLSQLWILIILKYGDGGCSWAGIDESSNIMASELMKSYLMEFSALASSALSLEDGILIFSR